jgi:hypothetical protein
MSPQGGGEDGAKRQPGHRGIAHESVIGDEDAGRIEQRPGHPGEAEREDGEKAGGGAAIGRRGGRRRGPWRALHGSSAGSTLLQPLPRWLRWNVPITEAA